MLTVAHPRTGSATPRRTKLGLTGLAVAGLLAVSAPALGSEGEDSAPSRVNVLSSLIDVADTAVAAGGPTGVGLTQSVVLLSVTQIPNDTPGIQEVKLTLSQAFGTLGAEATSVAQQWVMYSDQIRAAIAPLAATNPQTAIVLGSLVTAMDSAASSYGSQIQPSDEVIHFYASYLQGWIEEGSDVE